MRHNKHHASLGVTREHRKAMLSNMGASLIRHGRIQTTLTKAKALRPFIEKVITKAKKAAAATEKADAIHLRRMALKDIRDEAAVTLLFNEKAAQFAKRSGGYTRIYKLGPQRIGDAAEMALIEFVGAEDTGYSKSKARRRAPGRPSRPPRPLRRPRRRLTKPRAKRSACFTLNAPHLRVGAFFFAWGGRRRPGDDWSVSVAPRFPLGLRKGKTKRMASAALPRTP